MPSVRLFLLAVCVGLSISSSVSPTHAQTRTRTELPYPTVSKSVQWIVNVPYVTGGGPEQQLDLYIPTDRHGQPLVVYVHGGGFEHGDKAGDSINPNNLQWLWQGYAMASIKIKALQSVASGDWYGLVLAGFYLGGRLSDLAKLEWSNVDFDKGEHGCITFTQSKTGKMVQVPMHSTLESWLRTHRNGSGHVFPTLWDKKRPAGPPDCPKASLGSCVRRGLSVRRSESVLARKDVPFTPCPFTLSATPSTRFSQTKV